MTDVLTYPYKPKPWLMLLVVIFFAACAAVLGNMAISNDRGLIINGIISMGDQGATIFYAILTLLSTGFVVAGALGVWSGVRSTRTVQLTQDAVICPKSGLSKTIITVPYENITALETSAVQKQVFLHVHHTGTDHSGGKLIIARQMFPSNDQFETFSTHLADRVASQQTVANG